MDPNNNLKPEILAPAGNKNSFLAAIAAGADAIYCGLKQFSARSQAANFELDELKSLVILAHKKNIKVYIAINTLIKQSELEQLSNIIFVLKQYIKPDALIIADLSVLYLAEKIGFIGEIHLSTLINISFSDALLISKDHTMIKRIVLARELNIDEIKQMAKACPDNVTLEVFNHGALCYGVSGRCYWSSYLGGKSGLRGRCVQPCRRIYSSNGKEKRFFSCNDFSLDVLTKILVKTPKISALKIEGRKKGPHYVYYTVVAYKLLRDFPNDSQVKKQALDILEFVLGRNTTHFNILSQRKQNPISDDMQTASGYQIGSLKRIGDKYFIKPKIELKKKDIIRIGYEDEPWHQIIKLNQYIPKKGNFCVNIKINKTNDKKIHVFLIDRQEDELFKKILHLESLLENKKTKYSKNAFKINLPKPYNKKIYIIEQNVFRNSNKLINKTKQVTGIWINDKNFTTFSKSSIKDIWWWLPPVIWPEDEEKIKTTINNLLSNGAKYFVLNSVFQIYLFNAKKNINLWAGPFCNISNTLSLNILKDMGFSGAVVSPELSKDDYYEIGKTSPIPLGIVTYGNWPVSISRIGADDIKDDKIFISPKKEIILRKKIDSNIWIYPNWVIDLSKKKDELKNAGFSMFINFFEKLPSKVNMKNRQGLWNWNLELL